MPKEEKKPKQPISSTSSIDRILEILEANQRLDDHGSLIIGNREKPPQNFYEDED